MKINTVLQDISGTITTGGTAQVLAPANPERRGFFIQNNSAGSLWISSTSTAVAGSPSIEIKTGVLYDCPQWAVPSTAISIIGATTGQVFTARQAL